MGNPLRFVDPSGLKAGPGSGSDDDIDYSDMQQWQLLKEVVVDVTKRTDQGIATPFTSMMNAAWGITAQDVDFAILFTNETWKLSGYFRYSSDPDTLDKVLGEGEW